MAVAFGFLVAAFSFTAMAVLLWRSWQERSGACSSGVACYMGSLNTHITYLQEKLCCIQSSSALVGLVG